MLRHVTDIDSLCACVLIGVPLMSEFIQLDDVRALADDLTADQLREVLMWLTGYVGRDVVLKGLTTVQALS